MYCPKCSTEKTDNHKFCRSCGLNLEIISQLINDKSKLEKLTSGFDKKAWLKKRKNRLGNFGALIIMLSLAVGAMIPIALGLGYEGSSPLILIIAGIAGMILFSGIATAVYSDIEPKDIESNFEEAEKTSQTNYLPPTTEKQLSESYFQPAQSVTEATTNLLADDKVKVSQNH